MSNETPTIPDTAFTYAVNYIKLNVIVKLMSEIIPCDVINNEDFNDAFLYLRTTHKECGDRFETYTENESTEPKLTEETMGSDSEDEESDAQKEVPFNERGISKVVQPVKSEEPLSFDDVR